MRRRCQASVRTFRGVAVVVMGFATMGGCHAPRRSDHLSSQAISLAEPSPEADRAWTATQDVLRRHHFRLDRVDRAAGVITTVPETSQHFFEFWRHDVNTAADFWEATLNPMRRWVEVTLARGDDLVWNQINVTVHKERMSSPDRQFNSTGAAYQYFGNTLPSTTGMVRFTPEQDRWIRSGADPAMGDYLLGAILDQAGIARKQADAAESEH